MKLPDHSGRSMLLDSVAAKAFSLALLAASIFSFSSGPGSTNFGATVIEPVWKGDGRMVMALVSSREVLSWQIEIFKDDGPTGDSTSTPARAYQADAPPVFP